MICPNQLLVCDAYSRFGSAGDPLRWYISHPPKSGPFTGEAGKLEDQLRFTMSAGGRQCHHQVGKGGGAAFAIEVPGGTHIDVVVPNLKAVFDFFDSKRKTTTSTQQ